MIFCLPKFIYKIPGKVQDLGAGVGGEGEEGEQEALLSLGKGKLLGELPDEIRGAVDEHIPGAVAQVFLVYMKFTNKLRYNTLRNGACFFFVHTDSWLAQTNARAKFSLFKI